MNTITSLAWVDDAHVYVRETMLYADDESNGRIFDAIHGEERVLGKCWEDDELVHVSDDVWVFQEESSLTWQHVRDGRVEREVDLAAQGILTGIVLRGHHGELVVFARALHTFKERGDVLVVDAARGAILHKYVLPKCGAGP